MEAVIKSSVMAFADTVKHPLNLRLAALVLATACVISASVLFHFWPLLVGAALLAVSVIKYRHVFPFAAAGSFLIAVMDIPGREVWTAFRWVMLGIALFSSFIVWASIGKRKIAFGWFHVLASASVIIALLSCAVSVNPFMTALKGISLAALFIYCGIGVRLTLQGQEAVFVTSATVFSELTVYVFAVAYMGMDYSLFLNPNVLGGFLCILCWPLLMLVAMKSPLRYALPLGLCGYLLYLSQSRASMLAAFIASCFILLATKRKVALVVILTILTASLIGLSAYYPQLVKEQITSLLVKHAAYSGVMESRTDVWGEGLANIRERPWFGSGFGVSAGLSEGWQTSFSTDDANREKGNSYLAIIEGLGLIGSLAPLCVVGLLLKRTIGVCFLLASPAAIALAAVVLAGLVNAFFEAWLFAAGSYIAMIFWICAFLLIETTRPALKRRGALITSPIAH